MLQNLQDKARRLEWGAETEIFGKECCWNPKGRDFKYPRQWSNVEWLALSKVVLFQGLMSGSCEVLVWGIPSLL